MAPLSDIEILREQAILGLEDPFYLATEILKLEDAQPRTPEELRPIYDYYHQPRPSHLPASEKWLRFWSSPRFTAKTYIGLVYCLSKILRDPDIAILILCEQKQMARDSVKLLREWLMNPKIVQLYGVFESDEWGKEEFTILQRKKARRDPTIRAIGLDVPMQGKRCDFIWFDDLIGESNNHEEGIKKVESRVSAAMPLLRPGGEALYTCTRWNPYDPSTDGYTMSGQPGILRLWKQGQFWHAPAPRGYFGAYALPGDELMFPNAKVNEPLFPGVLGEHAIEQARATMSRAEFNSQILNNPLPDEFRHFNPDDLQYFDPYNPEGEKHPALVGATAFMAVDPNSGKSQRKNSNLDETTFCVGYIRWQGDVPLGFVMEWTGGIWLPEKTYNIFFEFLRLYKPRKIFIETNIGGEYFIKPIRERARELGIHYLPIEEIHQTMQGTGKKKARIQSMQEVYAYKRIWHARKLENCKGEDQLLRWAPEGGGHDDWPDVLAMWYAHATNRRYLPRDVDPASVAGPRKFNIMNRRPRYQHTGT